MNNTITSDENQQIINSIVSLTVNCVTALIILCIKFFDKKNMSTFLQNIERRNSEVIEKLSQGMITTRTNEVSVEINEPFTPSEQNYQPKTQQHVIPLDTTRNLVIRPK